MRLKRREVRQFFRQPRTPTLEIVILLRLIAVHVAFLTQPFAVLGVALLSAETAEQGPCGSAIDFVGMSYALLRV